MMSHVVPPLASLVDMAKELGYKGDEIRTFCNEQQNYYKSLQDNERAERALERDHEKLKLDKELELAAARVSSPYHENKTKIDAIRFPIFKDSDDITSYFTRFEKIATLLQVDKETYAVRVGSLLTGRAAKIYSSLPTDTISDYDKLKKHLLRAFNKTPETYRSDFRRSKISSDETYSQFVEILSNKFDFWYDSIKDKRSFEDLKSFIISDQFMTAVEPDLRVFLKEQNALELPKMAEVAENWAMAHKSKFKRNDLYQKSEKTDQFSSLSKNLENTEISPKPNDKPSKKDFSQVKCHACGDFGHIKPRCPKMDSKPETKKRTVFPNDSHHIQFCLDDRTPRDYMVTGTVNGSFVSTILRDSGCSCILVSENIVPNYDRENCKKITLHDYLGRADQFPIVKIYVKCEFFTGWTEAVLAPIKFASLIIGNVPGVKNITENTSKQEKPIPIPLPRTSRVNVVTRSRSSQEVSHPLVTPKLDQTEISPAEFIMLQQSCHSLSDIRNKVEKSETISDKSGSTYQFVKSDDLIYRKCINSNKEYLLGKMQLIVPKKCRVNILKIAHESLFGGHFSHRKTEEKIRDGFFWQGMTADIRDFCRSCDICQRTAPKGRVKSVPMIKVPIISEPFSKVAIDLVGPITPASEEGHKFILTLIDYATGFPEAVALKETNSIAVSEALIGIFARVGIPNEILSDQGPQFKSALIGELYRLLGIKPKFTTVYHPQANGRVERLHSTLKSCLKKLCIKNPKDWHKYLIPTLFALREIPSDRTGFSPFEMLYGRQVRGPLMVLRDLWTNKELPIEERTQFQYVLDLREKLDTCANFAKENSNVSIEKYKTYFDLKTQDRSFKPGDEVLVLKPDSSNKLLMCWSGPFKIISKKTKVDYVVNIKGKEKIYHANLLKKYFRRASVNFAYVSDSSQNPENEQNGIFEICQNCVIRDFETDENGKICDKSPEGYSIPTIEKTGELPMFNQNLEEDDKKILENIFDDYKDVFSEVPGCTDAIVHDIQLINEQTFRSKSYPVPIHLQPHFVAEVDKMLSLDIIRPSNSPFRSPVVMVKKSTGDYRMTIDFRELNAVTIFNAEPPCSLEEELHKFSKANYFSELDLTKAYHQIKLTDRSMPLTAFATPHKGLMEFTRLPFGLVTACATYAKLMRIVLSDVPNVSFYFDNVLVFGETFEQHCFALKNVLDRLRKFNLTAQPSKCKFGFLNLDYLGFRIGSGELKPQLSKIQTLVNAAPPSTKKCLQSFLGLVSFYRKFVPNMACLTGPMSDLLRKGSPDKLSWTEEMIENFNSIKEYLMKGPILKLPHVDRPFVLRTDASNKGIGAILIQYFDDTPHPIAYASRKLLGREINYSTIEKECLAIVWAVDKFKYYLLGKPFALEVDHKPLIYLNRVKGTNSRIMRWALALQPYRFQIVHVKGRDNVGPDWLSRASPLT